MVFNDSVFTRTVHGVLRTSAALSHGSLVFPYNSGVVWKERRATRGAPLLQWLLERETFQTEVVKQYGELSPDAVRVLVAGTGVGKSTKMPYLIAKHKKVNGIVLLPNDVLPLHLVTYLKGLYKQMGGEVSVVLLRSAHLAIPMQTPCVYFSSAATFLGRLASHPELLRDLGIDFIYLDESHERVPEYDFFKYAVSSGIIKNCKVFFGTATAASDVSLETGTMRKVVAVSPAHMSVESTADVTSKSPLHYTRIVNRTMVFMATDSEIEMWYAYYEEHDIPVYAYRYLTGTKPFVDIASFLNGNPLSVVLCHAGLRTGFTLPVETVVCTGYVQDIVTDFVNGSVQLVRTPVTLPLRIQGCGRVGRYMPGTAYYSNVEPAYEDEAFTDDNAFYIYLWAQVFSLKINDPAISRFVNVTGTMTAKAAAVLLHSRLPPVLLLPYVGNDGLFSGWGKISEHLLYTKVPNVVDLGDVNTSDWTEHTTGVVDYATKPIVFKSMIQFPREWNIIPAYAWTLYTGADSVRSTVRAGSIISAVSGTSEYAPVNPRKSTLSLDVVKSHKRVKSTGGRSVHSHSADIVRDSVQDFVVPDFLDVRSVVRDTLPEITVHELRNLDITDKHIRTSKGRNSPTEEMREHRVDDWRRSVPVDAATVRRVNSESSDERAVMMLRQVDPVKYKMFKLYPMDLECYSQLIEHEKVTSSDRRRVNDLLTCSVTIVGFPGDMVQKKESQMKYLLSVIRVHNSAVSMHAQLRANVNTSFTDRIAIAINGSKNVVDGNISETANLLKAFTLESWFVGVDKRSLKSSDSDRLSPDLERDEMRAKISLSFGPPVVPVVIREFIARAVPYEVEERIKCNAWLFGTRILSVAHAYEREGASELDMHSLASGIVVNSSTDDFVVFSSVVAHVGKFVMRRAREVENVYVVTYDVAQEKIIVIGDYELITRSGYAYLQHGLPKGCSGALILSDTDGALLGVYSGVVDVSSEKHVSVVVSTCAFESYIKA